jgi:hypothetical protein
MHPATLSPHTNVQLPGLRISYQLLFFYSFQTISYHFKGTSQATNHNLATNPIRFGFCYFFFYSFQTIGYHFKATHQATNHN